MPPPPFPSFMYTRALGPSTVCGKDFSGVHLSAAHISGRFDDSFESLCHPFILLQDPGRPDFFLLVSKNGYVQSDKPTVVPSCKSACFITLGDCI